MAILGCVLSFRVGPIAYPVGTGAFLGSFFDTVTVRLEDGQRGRVFPLLARLYESGGLDAGDAPRARAELNEAATLLQHLPASEVVWDAEHPDRVPPWGDQIAETILTARDYHVTTDGRSLIGVFDEALATSATTAQPLRIR